MEMASKVAYFFSSRFEVNWEVSLSKLELVLVYLLIYPSIEFYFSKEGFFIHQPSFRATIRHVHLSFHGC